MCFIKLFAVILYGLAYYIGGIKWKIFNGNLFIKITWQVIIFDKRKNKEIILFYIVFNL